MNSQIATPSLLKQADKMSSLLKQAWLRAAGLSLGRFEQNRTNMVHYSAIILRIFW
jgi:hypothetical protein